MVSGKVVPAGGQDGQRVDAERHALLRGEPADDHGAHRLRWSRAGPCCPPAWDARGRARRSGLRRSGSSSRARGRPPSRPSRGGIPAVRDAVRCGSARSSAASVPWEVSTIRAEEGAARPAGTHQCAWMRSAPASSSSWAARRSARHRPASARSPEGARSAACMAAGVRQGLAGGGGVAYAADVDPAELLLSALAAIARGHDPHLDRRGAPARPRASPGTLRRRPRRNAG